MSTQGKWFGYYEGQWFGPLDEPPAGVDVRAGWFQFNPTSASVCMAWGQFNTSAIDVRMSWAAAWSTVAPVIGGGIFGGGNMGLSKPARAKSKPRATKASRPYIPPTDPVYHDAVRKSKIKQEDDDLIGLVTAFLRVIT